MTGHFAPLGKALSYFDFDEKLMFLTQNSSTIHLSFHFKGPDTPNQHRHLCQKVTLDTLQRPQPIPDYSHLCSAPVREEESLNTSRQQQFVFVIQKRKQEE